MEIPIEILDKIFRALKSNPLSLYNCSNAHPIFSQIVEKYLYYHIIIPSRLTQSDSRSGYRLGSSRIVKLLSKTPHIVDYVRILEFSFERSLSYLREIAPILSKFRALQCINLPPSHYMSWQQLEFQCFKTTVDLRLPTLHWEIHMGDIGIPPLHPQWPSKYHPPSAVQICRIFRRSRQPLPSARVSFHRRWLQLGLSHKMGETSSRKA